jgi:hypothetical protein
MTTFRIPVRPSRYDEPGRFGTGCVLRVRGHRYSFSFVSPEGTCRRVYEGPILPGPYAYAVALPVIIAANPEHGSGAESRRLREAGAEVDAEIGDLVELGGYTFRIVTAPNDNIELHLADPELDIANVQADDILQVGESNLRVVDVVRREQATLYLSVTRLFDRHPEGPGESQPYPVVANLGEHRNVWNIAHRPGYTPAQARVVELHPAP